MMNFLTDPFLIPADRFSGPVLVTGAGGCIGAWVCAILSRSGIPVIASDLHPNTARAALVMGQEPADALNWEELDVTDGAAVKALVAEQNVQSIIHLAGLQVPFCAANPALGARVNVEGTINILEAARASGLKRTICASSVAVQSFPPGGKYKETLYGAYKVANEYTAYVYWDDWQVPSVCIRPNVVYGVGRDQGMSSKNTIAIQSAAMGIPFEIPFSGDYNWLYAGEAASAFIAAASQDGEGAHVFDLTGLCDTVENGLAALKKAGCNTSITSSGTEFPFAPDVDESALRAHVPDYPAVSLQDGINDTYKAFCQLKEEGRMPSLPG